MNLAQLRCLTSQSIPSAKVIPILRRINLKKEAITMSSLFKAYKMDTTKEQNGVSITYPANEDGSIPTFIVSRQSKTNQRYAKSLMRETKPYQRLMQLGSMDNDTSDKILRTVFCNSVLIGWENVLDAENQTIAFSVENALKLFELLPDLYDDLQRQSNNASLFLESSESDAKN